MRERQLKAPQLRALVRDAINELSHIGFTIKRIDKVLQIPNEVFIIDEEQGKVKRASMDSIIALIKTEKDLEGIIDEK